MIRGGGASSPHPFPDGRRPFPFIRRRRAAVGDYNPPVIAPARILHQLLQTDRLFGVEAVVRAPFAPAAAPAATGAVPAPAPKPAPARPAAFAAAPAAARPAPPVATPAVGAWISALEMPLVPGAPAPLAVLFISIEWGNPLVGEMRALFNRQVAAMKLAPNQAGLLRLTWTGVAEPPPEALAQAKAEAQTAAVAGSPQTVVLFGGFSLRAVAAAGTSLAAARGRWFDWMVAGQAVPTCATWHPCQLGLDRDRRAQTWEDLKAVCAKLGI